MGVGTFAARGVISRTISLPSSSTCGLKMACVARHGEVVVNARAGGVSGVVRSFGRVLPCGVALLHGLLPEMLGNDGAWRELVVLKAEAIWYARVEEGALTARGGKGRRRSRMGSPPETAWRRMLSWMKRLAVAGALAQCSRGIECFARVGVCSYELRAQDLLPGLSVSSGGCLDDGSVDSGRLPSGFCAELKIRHDVSSEALEIGLSRLVLQEAKVGPPPLALPHREASPLTHSTEPLRSHMANIRL